MKPLLYLTVLVGLGAMTPLAFHPNPANSAEAKPVARSEDFRVVGTEPFWGMSISKRGIVYSTPESQPRSFPYVAPMSAQGRSADAVRVYRLQGKPNSLLVINKVAVCSDGMSDKQYPYSATLILDNIVRQGCAEKK